MHVFIDEQLPPGTTVALRAVGKTVSTNGDDGCPGRGVGAGDDEVVAWCLGHEAILVTADLGRKSPEMIRLLRRYRQHVVFIKPEHCTAEQLLSALLKRWPTIADAHAAAVKKGRQTHCVLNPQTASIEVLKKPV